MKRIISLIIILVLLFSLASLASCGNDEQSKSKSPTSSASSKKPASSEKSDKSDVPVSSELSSAEVSSAVSSNASSKPGSTSSKPVSSAVSSAVSSESTLEELALKNNGTVEVYSFVVDEDWADKITEYFKNNYGGTLKLIESPWSNWDKSFINKYASNTAPDVVILDANSWPKLAVKNMVYNTEELKNKGVVGLDNPLLSDSTAINERVFGYKGKTYGVGTNMNYPNIIVVNDSLLIESGVEKLPSQYYKEGAWNWDNFIKVCQKVSTTGSFYEGLPYNRAYYGWTYNYVLQMNGSPVVTLDNDGKFKHNLGNSDVTKGLEMIRELSQYEKSSSGQQTNFGYDCLAMYATNSKSIAQTLYASSDYGKEAISFDFSIVPFPTTDNNTGYVSGTYYSYAIVNNTDNPQGAVNFVIANHDFEKKQKHLVKWDDIEPWVNSSGVAIIESLRSKITPEWFDYVGKLTSKQYDLWNGVKDTKLSISEVVTTQKPIFDVAIKQENESLTQ